jgi:lauroyl/myristoyl acyltransferase
MIRTHFVTYLTLILSREKLFCLVERVTVLRGMDHLQQAFNKHKGAIVVGLHSELFLGLIMQLSRRLPTTVLANIRIIEYSVAAERDSPFSTLSDSVEITSPMAVKSLVRLLRAGRVVALAFDVPPPSGAQGSPPRRIHFLDQEVPRYDTAAWLSTRTGKPILFGSIHREGNWLVIDFSAPLLPNQDLAPSEQVADLTTRLYGTAEQIIRRHPAAWLVWSYWHTLVVPPMVVPDANAPDAEDAKQGVHAPTHIELHHRGDRTPDSRRTEHPYPPTVRRA